MPEARFHVDTFAAFALRGDGFAVELPGLASGEGLGEALPQFAYSSLTPAGSEPWAFAGGDRQSRLLADPAGRAITFDFR